jgi:two-component system nitrogen regulation response regulator GlnG
MKGSVSIERHLVKYFKDFGDDLPPPGLYHRMLKELEIPLFSCALAATRGNQIKAAELLGLNRNTLRKKIRERRDAATCSRFPALRSSSRHS